jgi:hypothetical protein
LKLATTPPEERARAPWMAWLGHTLQDMQERGVVRQDINTKAMAFILDALTPSILAALSSHTKAMMRRKIEEAHAQLTERSNQ